MPPRSQECKRGAQFEALRLQNCMIFPHTNPIDFAGRALMLAPLPRQGGPPRRTADGRSLSQHVEESCLLSRGRLRQPTIPIAEKALHAVANRGQFGEPLIELLEGSMVKF